MIWLAPTLSRDGGSRVKRRVRGGNYGVPGAMKLSTQRQVQRRAVFVDFVNKSRQTFASMAKKEGRFLGIRRAFVSTLSRYNDMLWRA